MHDDNHTTPCSPVSQAHASSPSTDSTDRRGATLKGSMSRVLSTLPMDPIDPMDPRDLLRETVRELDRSESLFSSEASHWLGKLPKTSAQLVTEAVNHELGANETV